MSDVPRPPLSEANWEEQRDGDILLFFGKTQDRYLQLRETVTNVGYFLCKRPLRN